jgi:WD40 repeat protein
VELGEWETEWDDWRDRDSKDSGGKKVVSGSDDGAVKLRDIDTCKAIAKWTGRKEKVVPVCWRRYGRRVVGGSEDRTANHSRSIKIGHTKVRMVVYSPDTTLIATEIRRSLDRLWTRRPLYQNLGRKLFTTVKGHTVWVNSLAWTMDGKALQRFVWHASGPPKQINW